MRKIILSSALLLTALFSLSAATITDQDKARANSLVQKMTLEEKCLLIAGQLDGFHTAEIQRLGIPAVRMADGPQGVRNKTKSTYYPCGLAVAASWNRAAAYGVGEGIGQDADERGVGIMLCPGVNIYRSALCGRNFEYMGEDPYLASEAAVQYIRGIQSKGVMATIKHFATNNQEYARHKVASVVGERVLNEIYFPTFRKAVEAADVACVMTSYNPVNGTHAAENSNLIKNGLRAWGFEGIVMSDWESTYSTTGCVESGLDIEMPRKYQLYYDAVKTLIANGAVAESEIDQKCIHILQAFSAYGFLDNPRKDENVRPVNEDSRAKAYRMAVESPVLLKNENATLPIAKGKIVVVGPNANRIPFGGGSGKMQTIEGTETNLYQGLCSVKGLNVILDEKGENEAAIKAANAVIIAVGFDEKTEYENSDRTYTLPAGQEDLVRKVAAIAKKTIVVVYSGGEVATEKWLADVDALIMGWYSGQEGGKALADIISGAVSPSGRLPFTFWGTLEKNPATPYYKQTCGVLSAKNKSRNPYPYTEYCEGLFVGYRAVGHFDVKPLYPFGYGLTYSSFQYSDLALAREGECVKVCFTLKNEGKRTASEVAQVYVAPKNSAIIRPSHELKGYEKVSLKPGESRRITIVLPPSAFKYYDVESHSWKVDKCACEIQVCASSEDVKLSQIL